MPVVVCQKIDVQKCQSEVHSIMPEGIAEEEEQLICPYTVFPGYPRGLVPEFLMSNEICKCSSPLCEMAKYLYITPISLPYPLTHH
jgi:hypothetical protein